MHFELVHFYLKALSYVPTCCINITELETVVQSELNHPA